MATVQKGLTEQFVNLVQIPSRLELSFGGDIVGSDLIQPVRPRSYEYLPMTIELLSPDIIPDSDAAFDFNSRLEASQYDANYVGAGLVSTDGFFETMNEMDLNFQLLNQIDPLILYINPSDLTRTRGKRVQEQLGGEKHIVEHWGDEQDKLSANGKIGAYYTNKTGLTRYYRRDSHSYQQLMHLYIFYSNNGYIYETTNKNRISLVGSVKITYDTEVWVGQFDSFTMSESADEPYTMTYSFEFTARSYTNNNNIR